jgi:N-ethylmaleimide reductase
MENKEPNMTSGIVDLFTPLQLGDLELPNRILMAPLTRARTEQDHIPTPLMAEYYAQRASAGLLIAEATMVMPKCSAFISEPGICTEEQIEGWRTVTDAVHAKGGRIFLQLWHGGRACHPDLNGGQPAVAPSALAIGNGEVYTPEGKRPCTVPVALELSEIVGVVQGFRQAAMNAKQAGFDGVEIHGANGYLLDQFLRDGSNQRDDEYGGSIENRARLLLEVLEAACEVWGAGRVGVRLSPLNSFNDMRDSDPVELTRWLSRRLNGYQLAYLHLMRSDFFGQQSGDVVSVCREQYQGNLVGNMGYSKDEASEAVAGGQLQAVAFGVPYIANPDLVERFAVDAELNSAKEEFFYTPGPEGYTDYPLMEA